MNNIGCILRNDLGKNGRSHYDKIVGVLRPGQPPADVELTVDELMIVVSSLRVYLTDGGFLDPYWDLLREINKNTRATWKCTVKRMPVPVDTGECTPPVDTDTTHADVAPVASDPVAAPPADSPDEQNRQECRKRIDEWYKKDGHRKISEWMDKTGCNPCKHVDYFAMTGNIEMLECAHSAGWILSPDVPAQVAKSGDTAVFQWMCDNLTIDWLQCTIAAITAGHLQVLKIIKIYCTKHAIFWEPHLPEMYAAVASAGHVNIMTWLWFSGYHMKICDMCKIVSESGHEAAVAWCNDILH